jgi:HEAT repeat protein
MEDRLQLFERSLSEPSSGTDFDQAKRGTERIGELTEDVSPELVEALTDPDPGVRRLAIGSITEFGGEHTNFLIVEALNDPEPSVRCAAAAAAAQVGTTSAVFSLLLSLDDSAPEVRQEAKHAIEKITGQEIDFDPSLKAGQRKKKIDKLKDWWKEERFSRLAEDVQTVVKA